MKAEYLFSRGRVTETVIVYPYSYKYQFMAGTFYLAGGYIRRAVNYFRKTLDLFPWYFDARNNLIVAYFSYGELEKAKLLAEESLKQWPHHQIIQENLAKIEKLLDKRRQKERKSK